MPTTAQHFVYELQQDWDRQETYQGVVDIMKAHTAYGGEQESTEQVNCIVSSMHQAGPLTSCTHVTRSAIPPTKSDHATMAQDERNRAHIRQHHRQRH